MRAIRRLRPNEFGVVVYGSPKTSKQRAVELALLRAAHLTREQDRSHFTVVGQLAWKSDTNALIADPVLPLPVFVPVAEKATQDPVAVLIIRLEPRDGTPSAKALDTAAVIESLKQLKQYFSGPDIKWKPARPM